MGDAADDAERRADEERYGEPRAADPWVPEPAEAAELTAEEFYAAYCAQSGVDPRWLAAHGQRAYRCTCGEEGCDGWAMISSELVEFDRAHGHPTRGIAKSDEGYAPPAEPSEPSSASASGLRRGLAYGLPVALALWALIAYGALAATGHAATGCRYRAGGELPDRACTPGALNPAVRQATIGRTICVPGWTRSVRPSSSVTAPEKIAAVAKYGARFGRDPAGYEYDHLVPLELGGAANDPRNLWPEPRRGADGALGKDAVENRLRRLVCAGELTLARARALILRDWRRARIARRLEAATPWPPPACLRIKNAAAPDARLARSLPADAPIAERLAVLDRLAGYLVRYTRCLERRGHS